LSPVRAFLVRPPATFVVASSGDDLAPTSSRDGNRRRDVYGACPRMSRGRRSPPRRQAGAIGIDFNADHIAVSHLRRGNDAIAAVPLIHVTTKTNHDGVNAAINVRDLRRRRKYSTQSRSEIICRRSGLRRDYISNIEMELSRKSVAITYTINDGQKLPHNGR
jgi:hypothetical protein